MISGICQICTTSITYLHFCHMNLSPRKVYSYFQTRVQLQWLDFSTGSIHVVFNPLGFNLMLSLPSNTCQKHCDKWKWNKPIKLYLYNTWKVNLRRKTCVEGGHFQFGRTPLILLGAWTKQLLKIVFLKNIVQEKEVSQGKLNIWKCSSQSLSRKNVFICMIGVHATSLFKWYQNGLGKAIILRSCTSLVSELFIACVSADVKMCLSFMVQSCSFMKCAMLFYVHYNVNYTASRVVLCVW